MRRWTEQAAGAGAELALFPGLDVTGHIPHEVALTFVETVPGPPTEAAIELAGDAGVVGPWGAALAFVDREGNDAAMVAVETGPERLQDRPAHPNFLARELWPALC